MDLGAVVTLAHFAEGRFMGLPTCLPTHHPRTVSRNASVLILSLPNYFGNESRNSAQRGQSISQPGMTPNVLLKFFTGYLTLRE